MALFTSLPPELVEEILGHLHEDIITLKNCSTVALRFHLPCRKLLFSCIILDTPRALINLNALLNDSTNVATLIHALHLHTFFPTNEMGAVFLSMSHRLQHLRHLALGYNKGLSWSRFSDTSFMGLETLVNSDNLQSLEISHVYAIPLPFFRAARGIKSLAMEMVYIEVDKSTTDVVHFVNLEVLSLGPSVFFQTAAPLVVPMLCGVVVHGSHLSSLESANQFINSSSSVFKDFCWKDFHFNSIQGKYRFRIPLGVRRLTIEISQFRAVLGDTWSSILHLIDNSPAAQTMEMLTMIIKRTSVTSVTHQGYSFSTSYLHGFDILADKSRFPRLTRIEFVIESMTYDSSTTEEIERSVLKNGLLKLHEAGTPSVNLCIDSHWRTRGREMD